MSGYEVEGHTMEAERDHLHVTDSEHRTLREVERPVPDPTDRTDDTVTHTPADTVPDHAPDASSATTSLSPSTVRRRLVLADAAALLVGIVASFAIQAIVADVSNDVVVDQFWLILATIPVFAIAAVYNKLYQARANLRRLEEAMNIFRTVASGLAWLLLIALAVQNRDLSRLWVASLAIAITGAGLIERRIARSIFTRLRSQGQMERRIIVVGTDAHAVNLVHAYDENRSLGYKVVGVVGDHTQLEDGDDVEVLGRIEEVGALLEEHDAIGVVVSLNSVRADTVNSLTRRLTDGGYHVALSSSLRDIDVTRLRPQTQDGRTMIYVEPTLRDGWRGVAKRVFDLALATLILVLTLPIQVVTAILVASTSKGPIFFRQIRVGKDGELFEVLKFRTMYLDAEERKAELMAQNEADGPLFKMKNDPRITPVGRWLRKLSIDELPQLINVLVGSMSMVGPRPALPDEVEQWDDEVRDRLRVPPGLTGMWQVSGRSDSSFETYKRMDLYYVDNWSLRHDLLICAKTVGVVLSGSGAS